MDRQEILDKIADLNRQINAEMAGQKGPEFGGADARFPTSTIIAAVVVYAWYQFGDQLAPYVPGSGPVHKNFGEYGLYVAVVIGVLALIQIIRMLAKGKPRIDPAYAASAEQVRLLQDERRLLQEKLKSLGE